MKKRFVSACMAGLLAVSLAGCGGAGNSSAEAAKTSAEESKTEAATTAAESSETSTEAASEASESSAEGTFTVGFDQDFPPMGFVGDDGEYTGFDLELAQEVLCDLRGWGLRRLLPVWDWSMFLSRLPGMQRIWNWKQEPLTVSGMDLR